MNQRLAIFLPLLFAGCGGAAPGESAPEDPQAAALAALGRDTGSKWTVRYHADVHTPAFLEGRTAPVAVSPNEAARAARAFFANYGALFKMTAPDSELEEDAVEGDELGMTHVRFLQAVDGVPVHGRELSAHFAADGALVRVHGRYGPLAAIDGTPLVAEADARAAAEATVSAATKDGSAPAVVSGRPRLMIDPDEGGTLPRLAWVVDLTVDDSGAPLHRESFVDARTGLPYRGLDELDTLEGSGRGIFGEALPLGITERRGRYVLEDGGSGSPAQRTFSWEDGAQLPGREVSSDAVDRWDEAGPAAGAAVDAHAYVARAYGYYARVHGRDGALGDGAGMRATVHYGDAFADAFWNGKQLVFGDGDAESFAPLSGALDVVGHEYTHAVTHASCGLGHAGEPGALNEAISDLFGTFIEHDARGDRANWTIAEDVYLAGGTRGLRDLADPHRTLGPAHVDEQLVTEEDRGGVHFNSMIASHAGYLMSMGGTNAVSKLDVTGIGRSAAEKVWYRAVTRYLHPAANFRDAADATLAAARDLFGPGEQAQAVAKAWSAVGVLPER